jgi:predicted nucleic acid-binding protein
MTDSRVFLDASFWIAYRNGRELCFPAAQRIVRRLFQERTRFVITIPVFCEIHAFFSRHPGRRKMVLADFWNNPVVEFEPVSHQDYERAVELLAGHEDKDFSFCDALSFVVMKRLGVRRVATFDHHFRQVGGFEVIE